MDVLKVFNLIICQDNNKKDLTSQWFFNLVFAPIGILVPVTKFSILAWGSILLFTFLIYYSEAAVFRVFNSNSKGEKSLINSALSGFFLYIIQTSVIFLFLRYNLCQRTLEWEANDYHLTLQNYNNENIQFNI